MRVIVKSFYQRPGLARIIRSKQSRRLYSAVKRFRLGGITGNDLPDLLDRILRVFRKLDAVGLRLCPGLAKVVRRTQVRTPVRTVHRSPETIASVASVVSHRVDRPTGKVWSTD